ncbi:MAG: STAS domain-containing protein [Candidatus Hydrogenedentes bacterium]|nr:STAS domain-containing protein [Candidatus Hydrogenedentota bacterium]
MKPLELERDGARVRILLGAQLTAAVVPEVQAALKQELDAGISEFEFDLSSTEALDSSGIGLLIAASNSLSRTHGSIRLVNVAPEIMKLLQSMRLVERLHATASATEGSHG